MIEVNQLTKKYGSHTAVNNLSFTIESGEIVGFLGPNGAGKSTTMNMITGYLSSTSGSIKINGVDILEDPIAAKKQIGYLPELPPLYMDMTVKEYLHFVASLKKIASNKIKEEIKTVTELTKIEHVKDRLIKNLSKGYKQRVGVAQALLGSPSVLILDEPTVGLDPKQIIEIRSLIKKLSEKHTIILSSHILSEISAVCDRIIIINQGNLVASDTTDNLVHMLSSSSRLMIRVKDWSDNFTQALATLPMIKSVRLDRSREIDTMDILIEADEETDPRESIFNLCHTQKNPLLMIKPVDMSLEDIFLQVTEDNANTKKVGNE